jgi:hypothetical protein
VIDPPLLEFCSSWHRFFGRFKEELAGASWWIVCYSATSCVVKEVLPFMVSSDLRRRTACGSAQVAVSPGKQEVGVQRGIDLLLVSGVRLLHNCSGRQWEFDVD